MSLHVNPNSPDSAKKIKVLTPYIKLQLEVLFHEVKHHIQSPSPSNRGRLDFHLKHKHNPIFDPGTYIWNHQTSDKLSFQKTNLALHSQPNIMFLHYKILQQHLSANAAFRKTDYLLERTSLIQRWSEQDEMTWFLYSMSWLLKMVTQKHTLVSISLPASHMLALFHGLIVAYECGKE